MWSKFFTVRKILHNMLLHLKLVLSLPVRSLEAYKFIMKFCDEQKRLTISSVHTITQKVLYRFLWMISTEMCVRCTSSLFRDKKYHLIGWEVCVEKMIKLGCPNEFILFSDPVGGDTIPFWPESKFCTSKNSDHTMTLGEGKNESM